MPVRNNEKIVILTGAGISAESGLPTFRDKGGIWRIYSVSDLASQKGFKEKPQLVHDFYNARRAACIRAQPNAAHQALVKLEHEHRGSFLLITQNVDDLHQRAGSRAVLQMHGSLMRARCGACSNVWAAPAVMQATDKCPFCGATACRPDVVWFGESPHHMDAIRGAISEADLLVVIGSSGTVYPAAGFVEIAKKAGARTIEINLDPTSMSGDYDQVYHGPATIMVPRWVRHQFGDFSYHPY